MTFVLPVQVAGGAAGWQFVDWLQLRLSATATAAGVGTITCPQVEPGGQWLVDRVVIGNTGGAATPTVTLYDTTAAPSQVLDLTPAGKANTADYPAGLLIPSSGQLLVQWTGATAGSVCLLTVQARRFARLS